MTTARGNAEREQTTFLSAAIISAKRTTDRIVNVQDTYTFNVQVHNPGTAWKEGPVVVVRLEGWLSPGYLCQCTVQCWVRPPFSLDVRSVASVGM